MPLRDVIGHSAVIASFLRQVAAGTVSHAYLLSGPAGVGKAFLARQMAQTLLCPSTSSGQAGSGGDACGICPSCRLVERGQHPDVQHLAVPDGATAITIDQIRGLQHWLSLTPFHGPRKVAILDGADTMQEPAANALLKTLEEPPPPAVFLVTAAHEGRVLPTIVSRCARCACGPLPAGGLQSALVARGVAPDRAAAVARRADGRLGRALQLADPGVWTRHRAWLAEWHAAVDGGVLEPAFAARGREEAEEFLEVLAAWHHDVLIVAMGLGEDHLMFPDQAEALRAQAAAWSVEALLDAIERIYATRALIQQRANPRTAWATLIAQLARPAAAAR